MTEPHFRRSGSGPPVVLVHPGGFDERFWDGCVPHLAERLTVITFDRPHHGRNVTDADVPPPEVSSPGAFLAWLDERRRRDGPGEVDLLTRHLTSAGEPVNLVGVLDGGVVALRVATGLPHLLAGGVVTLDSVLPGIGADPAQVVDAAGLEDLQDLAEIVPSVLRERDPSPWVEWFLRRHDVTGLPSSTVDGLREMARHNAFSAMIPAPPAVSVTETDLRASDPRLLVLQSRDRPERLRRLDEALAAAVPLSRVATLPGTAFLPMSDPRAFSELVLGHLLG